MKRITYLAAVLLYAALSQACSYEFKLNGIDSEQRLFLNLYPSNIGYMPLSLYVSQPVGMKGEISPDAGSAKVSVTVNGVAKEVKVNEGELEGLPLGLKYIEGALSSGDKVSVAAEMDGLSPIESETTVPDAFPEFNVDLRKLSDTDLEVVVRYRIDTKGYYGMQIMERETSFSDGEMIRQNTYFVWPKEASDRFSVLSNTGDLNYLDFDNGALMIWEDGTFHNENDMGEYAVKIEYKKNYEGTSDYGSEEGKMSITYDYSFKLYCLSAETFRYFYSVIAADSDTFSIMGLSPPVLSYSNVKGGYGVLGGMHVTDSGWFENP